MFLPDGVLLLLFSFLRLIDVPRARAVCRRWNHLILDSTLNWDGLYRYDGMLWCPRTGSERSFPLRDDCGNELELPLASSHGLVLCKIKTSNCSLKVGNPVTGKWKELPPLPMREDIIPPTSAWRSGTNLFVDPESPSAAARFKVTIMPCGVRGSRRFIGSVLHFDSSTGEWVWGPLSPLSALTSSTEPIGTPEDLTKVHPRCFLRGDHHLEILDLDTLCWSDFRTAVPYPKGNSWWTNLFDPRTDTNAYVRVQGLGWAGFWAHVYQGRRVIGAGFVRTMDHVVGYAALELQQNLKWRVLCSQTFCNMFGIRDLKFDFVPVHWFCAGYDIKATKTAVEGDIIYWCSFENLPPVAYDIVKSTWRIWQGSSHGEYSTLTLNNVVSP